MIQSKTELDLFHTTEDPWGYENNNEDLIRKEILLNEIPKQPYKNVLDIGCGQGFITQYLPGETIWGVDLSQNAIEFAKKNCTGNKFNFIQGSIFEIDKLVDLKFDLVVITGVLYPQYIGNSSSLIYLLVDKILATNGTLISVHINEWYTCQFPYLRSKQTFYNYREYIHHLETYIK
ncbi:MAG: class I SAM-dependent methyltransferase [Bacteroidota bacterium]